MEKHITIARILTDLLENKFAIGKFRFGLDPVIGAIPGIGDLITAGLSLYLVWIGLRMGIRQDKLFEMIGNVIFDFIIGLFPVIGDFTDVVFKANSRNMKIIQQYLVRATEANIVH